ncbi:aspartyl-phosphate phosphatase Spo0E family protein [Paenibacillus cellulositrophicus]|uniref:aspartyl-phosphate phosphatase Spo0E family protein n=1 Tax=Paenibacillus cellulositrophicus TaxID=562959 RepID=UPI0012674F99|nr:aspartyl-phosphate phosphatase Spo0E family protein [Paenibacillus cellulositrophicus]
MSDGNQVVDSIGKLDVLQKEVEELREELNRLGSGLKLASDQVVGISQRLDEKITKLMRLKKELCKKNK